MSKKTSEHTTIKIKKSTYKTIKQVSEKTGIPITRLIEQLVKDKYGDKD